MPGQLGRRLVQRPQLGADRGHDVARRCVAGGVGGRTAKLATSATITPGTPAVTGNASSRIATTTTIPTIRHALRASDPGLGRIPRGCAPVLRPAQLGTRARDHRAGLV